ncbi:hypothetical protein [Dyella sp. GSA-30]|uniref:hypothetical protein n=1 Tax=Dyella sp. GSA-30 TaxID=2994496 RepID=UPI00248FB3FB|nr:hypothetical protein [Dyella sp. GSA-30]
MPLSERLLNCPMYTDDDHEVFCASDWLKMLDLSMDDIFCLVLQAMKRELGSDAFEIPSLNEGSSQ